MHPSASPTLPTASGSPAGETPATNNTPHSVSSSPASATTAKATTRTTDTQTTTAASTRSHSASDSERTLCILPWPERGQLSTSQWSQIFQAARTHGFRNPQAFQQWWARHFLTSLDWALLHLFRTTLAGLAWKGLHPNEPHPVELKAAHSCLADWAGIGLAELEVLAAGPKMGSRLRLAGMLMAEPHAGGADERSADVFWSAPVAAAAASLLPTPPEEVSSAGLGEDASSSMESPLDRALASSSTADAPVHNQDASSSSAHSRSQTQSASQPNTTPTDGFRPHALLRSHAFDPTFDAGVAFLDWRDPGLTPPLASDDDPFLKLTTYIPEEEEGQATSRRHGARYQATVAFAHAARQSNYAIQRRALSGADEMEASEEDEDDEGCFAGEGDGCSEGHTAGSRSDGSPHSDDDARRHTSSSSVRRKRSYHSFASDADADAGRRRPHGHGEVRSASGSPKTSRTRFRVSDERTRSLGPASRSAPVASSSRHSHRSGGVHHGSRRSRHRLPQQQQGQQQEPRGSASSLTSALSGATGAATATVAAAVVAAAAVAASDCAATATTDSGRNNSTSLDAVGGIAPRPVPLTASGLATMERAAEPQPDLIRSFPLLRLSRGPRP